MGDASFRDSPGRYSVKVTWEQRPKREEGTSHKFHKEAGSRQSKKLVQRPGETACWVSCQSAN